MRRVLLLRRDSKCGKKLVGLLEQIRTLNSYIVAVIFPLDIDPVKFAQSIKFSFTECLVDLCKVYETFDGIVFAKRVHIHGPDRRCLWLVFVWWGGGVGVGPLSNFFEPQPPTILDR